jgi:hypothetical protein
MAPAGIWTFLDFCTYRIAVFGSNLCRPIAAEPTRQRASTRTASAVIPMGKAMNSAEEPDPEVRRYHGPEATRRVRDRARLRTEPPRPPPVMTKVRRNHRPVLRGDLEKVHASVAVDLPVLDEA